MPLSNIESLNSEVKNGSLELGISKGNIEYPASSTADVFQNLGAIIWLDTKIV